jgi:hypothetical protein
MRDHLHESNSKVRALIYKPKLNSYANDPKKQRPMVKDLGHSTKQNRMVIVVADLVLVTI